MSKCLPFYRAAPHRYVKAFKRPLHSGGAGTVATKRPNHDVLCKRPSPRSLQT